MTKQDAASAKCLPVASAEELQAAHALRLAMTVLQRRLRLIRADHGVSASKLAILGHLYRAHTKLTAVELARLERLQPQSLTRNIAELEESGHLSRQASEADKRHIMITITQAGREMLTVDARRQTEWLAAEMKHRLTGTEQGVLQLAANLLEQLGRDSSS